MKKVLTSIIAIMLLSAIFSCSDEANPKFRIRNERSTKANVQVQTTGGNTININDVEEAETTEYLSAAEGYIVATAVIQNETISPTITFFASKDIRYTIVIQTGTTPSLRIDQD